MRREKKGIEELVGVNREWEIRKKIAKKNKRDKSKKE